jgi:hypothetical protein
MPRRMLLLAGGVALAVLAVVVVVGLRLTDDDEPPWSEQASAACERGLAQALEVVSAGEAIANDEKRALDVYAGATAVEAELIAELDAIPRPAADELAIERTLAKVSASHRADKAAITRLRRSFDQQLFERRVNDTIPILADLRSRFAALGAAGCIRYYDPVSYGAG